MIHEYVLPALIGLPIWWTGWKALDAVERLFTRTKTETGQ